MNWHLAIVLIACMIVAGCTGSARQPSPSDTAGPVHGDSGGAGGGGAGM